MEDRSVAVAAILRSVSPGTDGIFSEEETDDITKRLNALTAQTEPNDPEDVSYTNISEHPLPSSSASPSSSSTTTTTTTTTASNPLVDATNAKVSDSDNPLGSSSSFTKTKEPSSSLSSPVESSSSLTPRSTASTTVSHINSTSSEYTPHVSSSNLPPVLPPNASFSARLLHFHHCMNMSKIPRKLIHEFVFDHGVPDQRGMRSLLWKLLLNYLPWDHALWESSLDRSRANWVALVNDLSTNPFKKMNAAEEAAAAAKGNPTTAKKLNKIAVMDDPLSGASNEWNQYYKDEAIRHEIDKDVKRTYSAFHFFNERVNPIVITLEEARQQAREQQITPSLFDQSKELAATDSANDVTRAPRPKEDETHQDVIKRILFIYAKLNPGVRYVQGMNEILAPMYYVFAHDTSPLFQHHAEADAFFCFTNVMSDIRDRFIKSLDSSPSGVLAVVKQINTYLRELDPQLWSHLEQEKVDPRFYSFRWITLLLSQEFELPEVLRLWDSLFADQNRFEFLLYCCCSMLVCVRDRLLAGDFADALKLLQHYQENGIEFLYILATASKLKKDLEAQRRSEEPVNPFIPRDAAYYAALAKSKAAVAANAAAAAAAASPAIKSPSQQAFPPPTSSANPSPRPLSPSPSPPPSNTNNVSAQLSATGEMVQASAQQFFKSVSSFFNKK